MQIVAQDGQLSHQNIPGAAGAARHPGGAEVAAHGADSQSAFEDFWKSGGLLDEGGTSVGAGNSHLVTQAPGSRVASGSQKKSLLFLLILLLFLGAIGFAMYVLEWDVLTAIGELMNKSETEVATPESALKGRNGLEEDGHAEPSDMIIAEPSNEEGSSRPPIVAGNPYWALPNAIEGSSPIFPIWTAVQEDEWRSGIAHKYPYQRLKTVLDVRRTRRRGAQTILWEALEDKKAWPRLYAAIGLAEYNIPLAQRVLVKAIGRSRPELIAGFLERFVKKPNPGQAYVMRQAVRMLDESGRLTCLRAIWNTRDRFRDLYMAAATLDPGPRVREWVGRALLMRSMPLERFDALVAMVQGNAPFTGFDVRGSGQGQDSLTPDSDDFEANHNSLGEGESHAQDAQARGLAGTDPTSRVKKTRAPDQGDVLFFDSVRKPSPPQKKDQPPSSSNASL